jgi:Family of unknown function (DUF6159)
MTVEMPTEAGWPAAGPGNPSPATGKQLLRASWRLLRQDRDLLLLPVIGAVAAFVVAVVLFAPSFGIGWVVGGSQSRAWGAVVGAILAMFGASAALIYVQAALVIGANQRADGGDPSVLGVLGQTWAHRGKILRWTAATTTIGLVVRTVQERLGIFGAVVGFLGGVAWAIASFLVVPTLIAEDLGPKAAVTRSAHLIRQTWGTSVRTTLRLGFGYGLLTLAPFFVAVIAAIGIVNGSTATIVVGLVVIAVGLTLSIAVALVFAAVSTYARALIYRYATGRPVPGIDPPTFTGVFRPRRA